MPDDFDVIVIGAGPAGEAAAGRCADAGLAVAIVERELVGGECSYWACIPSKTLIRPGDALAATRRVPGAAEAVKNGIDVRAAFARRDYMTSSWHDEGQLPWLRERGIELLRGSGRLAGERVIEVGRDGSSRRLTARRAVVLATGTKAAIPPIPGLREIGPWDNRGATGAKELPVRLLVLGGGAVGATFTGPGLQELLHSATVAIVSGVSVDRLWRAVPSFPTVSEVWLHLLEAYGL